MKTRLVRIGNSMGIRLPQLLIKQVGLTDDVELGIQDGAITIRAATHARAGWAEAAMLMRARGNDCLIDPPSSTRFSEDEWEW
ncbi:MAG: AbrB/MazE/SpoVT family DNA-binding domain-containing protein [Gemmatimonadaceae bacterium]|nr:AbrB/MazE/SpoVT family DNA-binding domain-containing protein [Gemmatimonadaceae bacterium]